MATPSLEPNPFRSYSSVPPSSESDQEREKRREEEESKYDVEERRIERFCLFSDPVPSPQEVERRAMSVRKRYPEIAQPVLEFLSATAWHDRANAGEAAFFGWAERSLQQEGKQMRDMTPSDVERLYATFPDRDRFERDESHARDLYRVASKESWETKNFDQRDSQVHQLDLEDRSARYHLAGEDLQRRRTELLTAFERLIQSMPNSGRKSEFEIVYLIRRWAMEKRVGHLVTVQLGLPREDRASQKTDVWLIIAGIPYSLQLKTEEKDDAYREEFYQQVRAKAAAAIQGTQTKLAVIDTPSLMNAFNLWGKSDARADRTAATRAKHAVLDEIFKVLPPEAAEIFGSLTERKEVKAKSPEQGKRLTKDYLFRVANIPTLKRLGLLKAEDLSNPSEITKAKMHLSENLILVAKIVGSQEGFQAMDDEMAKKIAVALRGE